jgi:hypothetical protein
MSSVKAQPRIVYFSTRLTAQTNLDLRIGTFLLSICGLLPRRSPGFFRQPDAILSGLVAHSPALLDEVGLPA